MKRLVLLMIVLAILPIAVFADLGFGAAAFLKSPVLIGEPIDATNLNVEQFTFGGDGRLRLGAFQAEALLLLSAGDVNSLNLYLDAGLALDIAILTLSVGAGPNLTTNFGESRALQAGFNAKAGADIRLGQISFGLSYIMLMNLDNGVAVRTRSGLLGAQVIFWF